MAVNERVVQALQTHHGGVRTNAGSETQAPDSLRVGQEPTRTEVFATLGLPWPWKSSDLEPECWD